MRIVLSAFACGPGLGSEEGVGWGSAVHLAGKGHAVHVLTTPRYRQAIERRVPGDLHGTLSFSYFDFRPPVLLRCVVHSTLWQIYYYLWQRRLAAWAKPAVAGFRADLVHHVTYGRYWMPTSLWQLGRPLIWGPVGGGDDCPPSLLPCFSTPGRRSERLRSVARRLAHADPALRATAAHAAVAIAGTQATRERLLALGCPRVEVLLSNAVEPEDVISQARGEGADGCYFCCVGRLLDWKGQSLALHAFAEADIPGAMLVIIGAGPARRRLRALTAKLNLRTRVRFLEDLPRRQALQWIARSTAMVHAAIHDQSPTVVLEAMAIGTPVIALALGGLPLQLGAESGVLIRAGDPRRVVSEIALALRRLWSEPALRRRMGDAGRLRVRSQFSWARKAEQFEQIYGTVLAARARPDGIRAPAQPMPASGS